MKTPENVLSDSIYQGRSILKLFFIGLVIFLFAIWMNFPMKETIHNKVITALASNKNCPLQYKDLSISFFFPKIQFKDLVVPGRCFQNPRTQLPISKADVGFSFFGFFPPSIKLHAFIKSLGSEINVYPKLGLGQTDIRIHKTRVSGELISRFTKFPKLLKGNIDIEGFFELSKNKIQKGDFKAKSKNIKIPSQKIQGLDLPLLNLKNLDALGTFVKNKLVLKKLVIGNPDAPIHAEFKGNILLSPQRINFSKLDLGGRFKISKDFLAKFPIIKLLITGKPDKGYYKVKIGGHFARPKPQFL